MATAMTPTYIEKKIPSPEGIAAGQTATWKLPIGPQFMELQLAFSGVTLAQMTEIRILATGRPFQTFSAADRNTMNMFDGMADAADDGVLILPFTRRGLKTGVGEWETGVTTGVADQAGRRIDSLNVEIDIAAGASAPSIEMTASITSPRPSGPGTLLHIARYRRNLSGVGQFDISDLPKGTPTTIALNRTWFKEEGVETVERLEVERDGRSLWRRNANLNARIQADHVRVPQAGWFVLDKTERGYGGDPITLQGYNDFRFMVDTSGAQSLTIYQETMGVLGQ